MHSNSGGGSVGRTHTHRHTRQQQPSKKCSLSNTSTRNSCRIEKHGYNFSGKLCIKLKRGKKKQLCTASLSALSLMSRKTRPHTQKKTAASGRKAASFSAQTTRCYTTPTHSIPSEKTEGGGGVDGRTVGTTRTLPSPPTPPPPYQACRNNIKVFSFTWRGSTFPPPRVRACVCVNGLRAPPQAHP